MQTDSQWFDEGTTRVRDVSREGVTHSSRVVGAFHESTVQMGEGLCAGAELHLRADVVAALFAEGACAAGEADFEGDAVADFEGCYFGADGCDCAGGFVAETHGRADDEVAIAAVGVVVQVGAAEAGGCDGDLDVCASWSGNSAFFL
jgi:hypothetical protein